MTALVRVRLGIATFLLSVPSVCLAEAKEVHWWEVTTGIIAIPAGVIGLAYSFLLVKKTRLESKKTELEILEKEEQLRKIHAADPSLRREVVAPIVASRMSQYLLLRFVLLYLVLRAWGLVEDAYTLLLTGAMFTAQSVWHLELSKPLIVIPFLVLQKLPAVVYWLLFFAIGWPLFKDVNSTLGVNLRSFLRIGRAGVAAGRGDST